jgi:hypothetical protein
MNDKNAPPDATDSNAAEPLPAIEFESSGRFAVHNPEPLVTDSARCEPAPFVLGEHQPLERFSQADEARAHALALLQQARRSLCIYTDDLEPWLYHHSSIEEACRRFLLANPKNRLRILVKDLSRSVKDGHRLLSLSRRLTSNLLIRKLHPDYPAEDASFLLADSSSMLVRPEHGQFAGYALYQNPGRVRLQQRAFDLAWDTSILDPDLRSFLL